MMFARRQPYEWNARLAQGKQVGSVYIYICINITNLHLNLHEYGDTIFYHHEIKLQSQVLGK